MPRPRKVKIPTRRGTAAGFAVAALVAAALAYLLDHLLHFPFPYSAPVLVPPAAFAYACAAGTTDALLLYAEHRRRNRKSAGS
jgi:hypothetical protein